jgi:hypothetical protein
VCVWHEIETQGQARLVNIFLESKTRKINHT